MDALFYKDTMYGGGGAMRGNYFNPIIYSTEERVVGVGENDKPLYQKTIESDSIPADSDTTTGLTNIESYHVIAIEVINPSGNTEFSPNQISMYNYQGSGTWYGNVFLANNELKFNNNSRTNAIKIRAVIQYTKTTDVAGSGKYNTLGVPNVHYTTDEQVIGTWLGETLYQKTFDLSVTISSTSRAWYTVLSASDVQSNHMDKIFIDQGASYAIDPDDGTLYPIPYSSVMSSSGGLIGWAVTEGAIKICMSNISTGTMIGKITLRYTKTTY